MIVRRLLWASQGLDDARRSETMRLILQIASVGVGALVGVVRPRAVKAA